MVPIIRGEDGEKEAIIETARLMQVAARTAPKTRGIDDILTLIVFGSEKNAIAEKMREMARERGANLFERDAICVENSEAVLLIGVRGNRAPGLNCGACGSRDCKEFEEKEKRIGQDFLGPT
ncbi:MAG: (Fe-S)-binding protein, partial [Candidatus Bathyarchaeia archaeon]